VPAIRIYSRQGCHLCEILIERLVPILRGRHPFEVLDVDTDAHWQRQFGDRVPVVEIDGRLICEYRLDVEAIEEALAPRA
jgi:hypothetical protein